MIQTQLSRSPNPHAQNRHTITTLQINSPSVDESHLILRWLSPASLPAQRVTSHGYLPHGIPGGKQAAARARTSFIPPGDILRASALAAQTEVPKGMGWGWRVLMGQVERAPIIQAGA